MGLAEDAAFLSQIEPFARFDNEAVRLIAFDAEKLRLSAGDVVFRKGDPSDSVIVVVRGALALDPIGLGGPAARIVGPGEALGVVGVMSGASRAATAIAREPGTAYRIPRALIVRVLEAYPGCAARWRALIADRLRRQTHDFAALGEAMDVVETFSREAAPKR